MTDAVHVLPCEDAQGHGGLAACLRLPQAHSGSTAGGSPASAPRGTFGTDDDGAPDEQTHTLARCVRVDPQRDASNHRRLPDSTLC